MPVMNKGLGELDALALEELFDLRERVESLLDKRLASEKLSLRKKLAQIERYERRKPALMSDGPAKGRRRVSPKYRDPSSGSTWTGRGKVPRWMKRLMEQGAQRVVFWFVVVRGLFVLGSCGVSLVWVSCL